MTRVATVIALSTLLSACGVEMKEVGKDEFNTDKIAYYQDKRVGVCYGVVSYQRQDTGGHLAFGLSFTYVPCTDAVLHQAR